MGLRSNLAVIALATACTAGEPLPEGPETGLVTGTHVLGEQSADWSFYVPESEGVLGAAVLLPGDTWPHDDLTGQPALQAHADATGLIIVSVDAPGPPTSQCWWTPHKHERTAFLVDLLETELFAPYEVDRDRVHLGGWSGGAFLAFGAPFYVELPFSGGLVGACGGDIPRQDSATDWCVVDEYSDDPPLAVDDAEAADLAAGRRVYAARNDDDDWVDSIDASVAFWEEHGATTRLVDEGPGGHCAFDVTGRLVDGLVWIEE